MSGDPRIRGALSAIVVPFAEEAQRWRMLPPHEKETERAVLGGFLIGSAADLGWAGRDAIMPAWWNPGLLGVGAFGLLLLAVGLRRTRYLPRSIMGVFWTAVVIGGGGWAVVNWWHGFWANPLGRAFCIGMLCGAAVRLYIALRGTSGNARDLVEKDIRDGGWDWEREQ
jgi:hypothetical protein